eukprot:TRINITY_DN1006_c1_g1_i1.p1 TRINITY_DN1006_c1_g1~~TRINITY_DN1006_c1_g1_i1.p1  ORF type:complete len:468 (-),score=71.03 TRINITY_DN1006_c1_g1_i1:27-1238(-)
MADVVDPTSVSDDEKEEAPASPRAKVQVSGGVNFGTRSPQKRLIESGTTVSDDQADGPLILFINGKSGGNQGIKLLSKFKELLPPEHVFDLGDGGPDAGLEEFRHINNLRILVCGGDGSACWVMSRIDKLKITPFPAIGMLPLGTGNDLARTLGMGGGYEGESLEKILQLVDQSRIVPFDRWLVDVRLDDVEGVRDTDSEPVLQQDFVMNNYFSVGVDAEVALSFHKTREASPHLFPHRAINKAWYGVKGMESMVKVHGKLSDKITLEVDGKPVKLGKTVRGVIILNVPSWAGGNELWSVKGKKASEFSKLSINDGMFEVVGLKGAFHMGRIQANLGTAKHLAQGRRAVMRCAGTLPAQVDGEPWMLHQGETVIELHNQSNMLMTSKMYHKREANPEANPEQE